METTGNYCGICQRASPSRGSIVDARIARTHQIYSATRRGRISHDDAESRVYVQGAWSILVFQQFHSHPFLRSNALYCRVGTRFPCGHEKRQPRKVSSVETKYGRSVEDHFRWTLSKTGDSPQKVHWPIRSLSLVERSGRMQEESLVHGRGTRFFAICVVSHLHLVSLLTRPIKYANEATKNYEQNRCLLYIYGSMCYVRNQHY